MNRDRSEADWHCIRFNQKSPVAGYFFLEYRTKVQLLSRSELVKSPKDDFPADGGDICRCRKIFC